MECNIERDYGFALYTQRPTYRNDTLTRIWLFDWDSLNTDYQNDKKENLKTKVLKDLGLLNS